MPRACSASRSATCGKRWSSRPSPTWCAIWPRPKPCWRRGSAGTTRTWRTRCSARSPPRSTLEEMTRPEIMADLDSWTLAWGLGLELLRRGDRIMVGHEGAMPGFLACVAIRRIDRVGAVVLCNTSAAADPATLALDLIEASLDAEPPAVEPWRPGPP